MGKQALLVLVGMVAVSSLSFAIPLCTAGLTVASLGAEGCGLGSTTFTNFALTPGPSIGGVSANATDPTHVRVTIDLLSDNYYVTTTTDDLASWSLTGAQQFSFALSYTVTGSGAYFDTFRATINATSTPATDAAASMSKGINNVQFLNVTVNNPEAGPVAFIGGPFSGFNVVDNFSVVAAGNAAALISGTNSFHVPEPMSSMLLGSGLLALGFLWRRKRS